MRAGMDYYKLSSEITRVVIEALQHFDHIDREGPPPTLDDALVSIYGAVDRYRNDPVFRARTQMLVSRITAVVQNNETHNALIQRRR